METGRRGIFVGRHAGGVFFGVRSGCVAGHDDKVSAYFPDLQILRVLADPMPVERERRRALRPFTERSCVCRIVAEPEVDAGMSAEHSGGPRPDVPYSAGTKGTVMPYQTYPSGNFRTGRWCSVPQAGERVVR